MSPFLRPEFARVRPIATFWHGLGISDDEQGVRIYLATGLATIWAHAWQGFRKCSWRRALGAADPCCPSVLAALQAVDAGGEGVRAC